MWSAPAFAKASRYGSHGSIIRWQSKGLFVCGRNAATTGGPKVMLGTKWPSITSRWIQSAPAAATARTSSPSFEKSDDRIEGAMITGLDTRRSPCRPTTLPMAMRPIDGRAAVASQRRKVGVVAIARRAYYQYMLVIQI